MRQGNTRKNDRKEKRVTKTKTLSQEGRGKEGEVEKGKERKGFFACYLLTSLCPRSKGRTYIGYTVNPQRRIRQHNGEITSGAFRTKIHRPWEMVLCLYGFPTNVSALQFEWAWQHPSESIAVRQAAAAFKSFSGVANKIKLAYTMLNLPQWQSLNITVNLFSTKYSKHCAGCPSLPLHMKVQFCPMDELPCYIESNDYDQYSYDEEKQEQEENEKATNCSESVSMNFFELQLYTRGSKLWENSADEPIFQDRDGQFGREEDNRDISIEANDCISDITKETQLNLKLHDPAGHGIDTLENSGQPFTWYEGYCRRQHSDPLMAENDQECPILLDPLAKTTPPETGFTAIVVGEDEADHMVDISDEIPSEMNAHISTEDSTITEQKFSERCRWYEESGRRQQRDRCILQVDYDRVKSIGLFDSPYKATTSVATSPPMIEIRDDTPLKSLEDSLLGLDPFRDIKIMNKDAADNLDPRCIHSVLDEIEVINLLSPSPLYKIKPQNKKGSVSYIYPEIIDLT